MTRSLPPRLRRVLLAPSISALLATATVTAALDPDLLAARPRVCSCGGPETAACRWVVEQSYAWPPRYGFASDDPTDECWLYDTIDGYHLGLLGASVGASWAWAYRDCVGNSEARAVGETTGMTRLECKLVQRCSSCLGRVNGVFAPQIDLCAAVPDPAGHAFIAAAVSADSSVADRMTGQTNILPDGDPERCRAEASAQANSPLDLAAIVAYLVGTFDGGGDGGDPTPEIRFDPDPAHPSWDVGTVRVEEERWYQVDATTNFTITFRLQSFLNVDVGADNTGFGNGASAEAWAKTGEGTWDTVLRLQCIGGCWDRAAGCGQRDETLDEYEYERGKEATTPSCETAP